MILHQILSSIKSCKKLHHVKDVFLLFTVIFPLLMHYYFILSIYSGYSLQCKSILHSSPKETQLFWGCLSFGEECRSVNFRPNFINTILLVFCKLLSRPFHKIDMTLGQGHKASGTRKNGQIKVAFLLGKSVIKFLERSWQEWSA